MQNLEECLLMYRRTLRQGLGRAGVASNPGVTDVWILEKVLERMDVPVEVFEQPAEKEEDPLDVLNEHFTKVKDFGYFIVHPADILRAIDYAQEGKLKGMKVGL